MDAFSGDCVQVKPTQHPCKRESNNTSPRKPWLAPYDYHSNQKLPGPLCVRNPRRLLSGFAGVLLTSICGL
eukprot:36331-Amphidinium_carterae.2